MSSRHCTSCQGCLDSLSRCLDSRPRRPLEVVQLPFCYSFLNLVYTELSLSSTTSIAFIPSNCSSSLFLPILNKAYLHFGFVDNSAYSYLSLLWSCRASTRLAVQIGGSFPEGPNPRT